MPNPPAIAAWQKRIEVLLTGYLPDPSLIPERLHQAMRYSVIAGGKRIRPLFVYASGRALGIEEQQLDAVAAAIELIHTYSLIHDDLPSMDDDDLRRGHRTHHVNHDPPDAPVYQAEELAAPAGPFAG